MSGVQFWQFPNEEEAFLTYLEKTGTIIAFLRGKFRHKDEFDPMPLEELLKKYNPEELYFCLDHYFKDVVIASYTDSEGEYFVIDLYKSPLIGYTRGRLLDSDRLSTCSLEAYWSYSIDRKTSAEKQTDFVQWAKKVFRWVQKATPEFYQHKHCRITSRVAEAIQNNQVDLVGRGGYPFTG
jgi:hypothetical protein